jgi:hypothetical protein
METKIRAYIDELFSAATPSRKSVELKEEMIQNLTEKYNDLLAEGKTPEASYNIAIAGIGDISGLLKDLEKDAMHPETLAAARRKSAMLTSIAIMMYIISVVPLIVLGAFGRSDAAPIIGVAIMFFMIAGATGILIYNDMTKPKIRREDTMVEEFKQWQTGSRQERALRSAVSAALWAIAAATYFIVSFLTGYWHMTWLIFLVAVAVQAIINAAFTLKK